MREEAPLEAVGVAVRDIGEGAVAQVGDLLHEVRRGGPAEAQGEGPGAGRQGAEGRQGGGLVGRVAVGDHQQAYSSGPWREGRGE